MSSVNNCKTDTENIRGLNLAAVKRTTVQASRLLFCSVNFGMICCTEPVLTNVWYILHILKTCNMYNVNYFESLTMD
jgi:hypothetical protein